MLDLLCIGMSHAHSVNEAYLQRRQGESGNFTLTTLVIGHPPYQDVNWIEDGHVKFSLEFDRAVTEFIAEKKPKAIFTYLTGAQHFHLSFINSPRPFDVVIPGADSDFPQEGCEVIPYDLMLSVCEVSSGMNDWLVHLRELTDLPIYQIGLPPPVAGEEFLRSQARGELLEQIERYGIAPEALRSKVWQICLTAVERQCAKYGVHVIRPPREALGDTSCLLPQFRGHDAVHANAAYGSLLIDLMVAIAERYAAEGNE